MKKLKFCALCLLLTFSCFSCSSNEDIGEINMIAPNGTPLLSISTFLSEHENVKCSAVEGSEPLLAAFTSKEYDLIVAPMNLGAQLYNKAKDYLLFETLVWGNLYVASRNEMTSFSDLNEKNITLFGTNQTPDIVMKCLSPYHQVEYNVTRVDDVSSANALLLQNQAEYIVSAEPSLSKLKEKMPNLYTLDLQEEWKTFSGISSYPQAGIFVKKDEVNRLKSTLLSLRQNVKDILKDVSYTVSCALKIDKLASLGETTLTSSLPNCHIAIEENQQEAIEFYFTKLNEIGLGKTYGEKLPDEEFYITL